MYITNPGAIALFLPRSSLAIDAYVSDAKSQAILLIREASKEYVSKKSKEEIFRIYASNNYDYNNYDVQIIVGKSQSLVKEAKRILGPLLKDGQQHNIELLTTRFIKDDPKAVIGIPAWHKSAITIGSKKIGAVPFGNARKAAVFLAQGIQAAFRPDQIESVPRVLLPTGAALHVNG